METVDLKRAQNGAIVTFEKSHALNILLYEKKKGFKNWLVDDKNWEFVNDDFKRRANPRANQEKPTKSTNTESESL